MPRPRKPARLYQRPGSEDWIVRDGDKDIRTGHCGERGRRAAEEALAEYVAARVEKPDEPLAPKKIGVSFILAHYLKTLPPTVAAPERAAYAVKAMSPFWVGKNCGEVSRETCEAYLKWRLVGEPADPVTGEHGRDPVSGPTAQRELGVLQAALDRAAVDHYLFGAPRVVLPPKGARRTRFLTRSEAARVLWALWRGAVGSKRRAQHAARYLVAALYAGSRPATVLRTTWVERQDGPWVDLAEGVWHRRGEEEAETNKRRGAFVMSDRLLAHLRRWRRVHGGAYVIERNGKRVVDVGKALESACARAGVKRITPHALKHTAITLFIKNGGTAEEASKIFSTSLQTIESTYWRHSPEHQRAAAKRVGRAGR